MFGYIGYFLQYEENYMHIPKYVHLKLIFHDVAQLFHDIKNTEKNECNHLSIP